MKFVVSPIIDNVISPIMDYMVRDFRLFNDTGYTIKVYEDTTYQNPVFQEHTTNE